jgi:hypothetical protein
MINVWGDSIVCGCVAHLCRKEIPPDDEVQQETAAEAKVAPSETEIETDLSKSESKF